MEEVKIKLSKRKLLLLLLGAMGFTFFSILFILHPEQFTSFLFFSEDLIRITGYIGAIFFGLATILLFTKVFDEKSGLIINKEGIIDNTNASSVGFIKWSDITNVTTKKVVSTQFILIVVKNPEEYIERVNHFKKFTLRQNKNSYGTPITLTSVGLQCSFEELMKLILDKYELYKEKD